MSNQQQSLYAKVFEKLKRREGLFRVLMFTLVTVFCWIGFSIFLSQNKTKVEADVRKFTIPLNPNIDRLTLSEISQRRVYADDELEQFPIYKFILDSSGNRQQTEIGSESIVLDASLSAQPVDEQLVSSESAQLEILE